MMSWKLLTQVYNLPSIRLDEYVVARECDGKLWYYGTYKTRQKAEEVADELNKLDGFFRAYVIGGYYD